MDALIKYRMKITAAKNKVVSWWINKDIWPIKNWKKYLANTSNAQLDHLINEADLVKLKGSEWLCHSQTRQAMYV
jgi:hypothetical protein